MAVPKRVAAHIIRKPVVETAVCEVIDNPAETSRVDLRDLQHMLANASAPIDLETDIAVCADSTEQTSARSTRLAHTVRRADTAPIAPEPAVTVEIPVQMAEIEPELAAPPVVVAEVEPEVAAAPIHNRAALYATAAAVVVAAVALMLVIMTM